MLAARRTHGQGRSLAAAAVVAVGVVGCWVVAPALVALLVACIVSVLGLVLLTQMLGARSDDPAGQRRVMGWTMASFGGHLLLGLVIASSPTFVTYLGGDADTYHQGAMQIVDHWTNGGPLPRIRPGTEGFYYGLGAVYLFLGPYRVAGVALIAGLSAALVPLVSDTTERLFGRPAARVAGPLVVLLPGFLVWTSQLLREAPALFLLAAGANCAVRLSTRARPSTLGWLALTIALLFTVRANVALVFVVALVGGLVLGRRSLVGGLGTGLTALVLVTVLVIAVGIGSSGYQLSREFDLEQVDLARQDLSTSASSGFAPDADVSTPERAITFLPVGLVSFSFGPFPWQVANPRQLAGLLEVATLWALVPSLARGLRRARALIGRQLYVLTLPALLLACMLSLLIGNYGTVVRERLQVIVLVVPVIALGWSLRHQRH